MDDLRSSSHWIPIASFIPTKAITEVIDLALREAQISFRTEGSRATEILVTYEDVSHALEVLGSSSVASQIHLYPIDKD
jgi:hypothetical protein